MLCYLEEDNEMCTIKNKKLWGVYFGAQMKQSDWIATGSGFGGTVWDTTAQ